MKFAYQIAEEVRSGRVSAEEVVRGALGRAESVQKDLNAFITIAHDAALARARRLDEKLSAGETLGPLAGVPIVVKDNICTAGIRTTAGSKSLDFVPPYSATVVARLEAAGAVVIAKANLDEFGMGGSGENSAFGATRNPWDPSKVPGGSSSGSAAAVSAGVAPLALGTDTGGSVRQPAAYTGLIGFKPTYGRLSRYGVIAFASSLDQIGVLCRSPRDLALTLDAASGPDPYDATSLDSSAFVESLESPTPLEGLRIGVIQELSGEGNREEVSAGLERMVGRLESLGARLGDASIPNAPYGVAAYYLVGPAEASANLARFDAMLYSERIGENRAGQAEVMMRSRGALFGPEVRRRILMGTYALSAGYYDAYYGKALKVRRLIADDFERAFKDFDLLMTPTTPSTAYALGKKSDDPLAMYLDDIDTVLANLVGVGAITVPAGTANGLPRGIQLFAPTSQDEKLVAVAAQLERNAGEIFAPTAPDYA